MRSYILTKNYVVVNYLSKKYEGESLFYLSLLVPYWLTEAQHEWLDNGTMAQLIQRI
jgi:hypothetical protein